MRLNFSRHLSQLINVTKLATMAGVLGMGLLAPTAFGQDEAPAYTPGSVAQKPFSLLKQETWTPPETAVQTSPSDWVAPKTDTSAEVQKLVVESEDTTQPLVADNSQQLLAPPLEEIKATAGPSSTPDYFESPIEITDSSNATPLHSGQSIITDSSEATGTSVLTDSSFGSEAPMYSDGSGIVTNEFYAGDCSACETGIGSFDEGVVVEGGVCQPGTPCAGETNRPLRAFLGKGRAALSGVGATVGQGGTFDQGISVNGQGPGVLGAGRAVLGQARSAVGQARANLGQRSVVSGNGFVQTENTPVRNILRGAGSRLGGNPGANSIGQLTFLSFARDYRTRGRQLSRGAPNLFANGPDENQFTGVDFSYGQRRAGGRGWEWRFIGFNPGRATDVAGSGPELVWGGLAPPLNDPAIWPNGVIDPNTPRTFGLSGIGFGGLSMADVFGDAQNHRVSRDSEFGSFEFNLLRATCGGSRLTIGSSVLEVFGGLRAVAFNETTVFTAAATQSAISPASAFYASEVKNGLFGLQVGGRLERPLRYQGWGMSFGTRVGIYNNRVESRQHAQYQFADGSRPTPVVLFGEDAGRAFDVTAVDHELAFLGELDFGVIYRFRPQTRARFGFRGIAVTNVATAGGQLENNLFDLDRVAEPDVLGDFIVGGLYFGVDHAF